MTSLNGPCLQIQAQLRLGVEHINGKGNKAVNNYEKCFELAVKKQDSFVSHRITNSSTIRFQTKLHLRRWCSVYIVTSQITSKLNTLKLGHFILSHESEVRLGSAGQWSLAVSCSFNQMVAGTGVILKLNCDWQLQPPLTFSLEHLQVFCAAISLSQSTATGLGARMSKGKRYKP